MRLKKPIIAVTAVAAYPPSAVNNGDRKGLNWGNGGGWNDATGAQYPDWIRIDFNGAKSIDRVVVYTLQDNYLNPIEPTDTQTFSLYGVTDFTVEGWNGSSWSVLASVSGNNRVKRTVTFASFTTTAIRVSIARSLYLYSRIVEIEAWGSDAAAAKSLVKGKADPSSIVERSSQAPQAANRAGPTTTIEGDRSSPLPSNLSTDESTTDESPIDDLYGRVSQIEASHHRKLDRILAACAEPRTINELSKAIYANVHGYEILLAIEEIGAHVEYLDQRGELAIANLDEVAADECVAPMYRRV